MNTKYIIHILQCGIAALAMASCNLFIEDDGAVTDYGDVPVHTGVGYDAPVQTSENGCDVTYQFKSEVRHLTERDLPFITYVRHDETGALVEVHYAGNTPQELLPVAGEILVSGANDKFEWGCCHRIGNYVFEGGEYRYLGTICNIKEVYEVLEIDGNLTTEQEEEYWVTAEPEAADSSESAQVRTRAPEEEESKLEVSFLDDGFSIKIPWGWSISGDIPHASASIEVDSDKNFTKITLQANFDDFSLTNPIFKLIKTVEDRNTIAFGGSLSVNKHKTYRPIKGRAFTIGPVVVVFFVNIDVDGTLAFQLSAEFTRHKKVVYTYTVDLYYGTIKEETKKVVDEPWALSEVDVSFSFETEVACMFGYGFYGKVFSVRFGPFLTFSAQTQRIPKSPFDGLYDASSEPGLALRARLGGKVQFIIDFTFDDLFGSPSTLEWTQANLDKAEELLAKNGEFYEHYKNDTDVKDFVKGDDKEVGVTIRIGPWTIWGTTLQWYPSIVDNSFITSKYMTDDGAMGIRAEYKIKDEGLLGSFGDSDGSYCPALRITQGKRLRTQVDIIYPEEGSTSAKVREGQTYHFIIPQMQLNKEYNAQVCYLERGSNHIAAVDKSLPFTFYSPAVILESVEPVALEENPEGWNKEGKLFCYLFKVDSRVKVEGAKAIYSWGVTDKVSGTNNSKSKNNANKDKDGIWTLHWYLKTCTNYPISLKKLQKHLDLEPYFRLESTDENQHGNHYEIMVYSDGTYDILDDGDGTSITGLTYDKTGGSGNVKRKLAATALPTARSASIASATHDPDLDQMWLESIEDPDGNIVYLR